MGPYDSYFWISVNKSKVYQRAPIFFECLILKFMTFVYS